LTNCAFPSDSIQFQRKLRANHLAVTQKFFL